MRSMRVFTLLGVLLALALVAAACGNDDDGDTSADATEESTAEATEEPTEEATAEATEEPTEEATAEATEEPTEEATGEATEEAAAAECDESSEGPLRIGVIGELQSYAGLTAGVEARINRVNEEGGICGRMLEVAAAVDDGSDPQANLDGARSLVENDGVYAIVATSAVSLPQTTDYLADNQIPFSGWGFMPGFCLPNEWGFGFNGCLSGWAFGVPDAQPSLAVSQPVGELLGNDEWTLVLFNSDDEAGEGGSILYNALWGDRILAEDFVPTAGQVTDFTPYVNQVLENEPDAVVLSTDFATAIPLKAAIIGAGYEGPVVDYTTYVPGLLQDAGTAGALEGGYTNTQVPPQEEGREATAQIATDLEAIGEAPFVTLGASIGYWSMDVLVDLMQATAERAGTLDKDAFDEVANVEGVEIDFGGLDGAPCPFDSLEAHVQPVPGAALVQVEEGEYVPAVSFACWDLLPLDELN